MNTGRLVIVFFATFWAAVCPKASAGPASMVLIPDLTAKADAVVVAVIQASTSNGTVNATIDVERSLKGSLTVGSLISVACTLSDPTVKERLANQPAHGIVFLAGSGAAGWSILPVVRPARTWRDTYIPIATTPPSATDSLSESASPLDRVCAELAASTEAGTLTGVDLLYLYRISRSSVLEAAFRRFSSNSNEAVAMLGLAGRVAAGETAALELVKEQEATLAARPYGQSVIDEIKYHLETDNPGMLHLLGQMAVNSKFASEIRIAAGVVLSTNHSLITLPYLAQLLDDPSITLQGLGVRGLARFANNVPAGRREQQPAAGKWVYRTDETIANAGFDERAGLQKATKPVAFWKSWWQQNRTALAR